MGDRVKLKVNKNARKTGSTSSGGSTTSGKVVRSSGGGSSGSGRDTSRAGQTVKVGGQSVRYDSDGYAVAKIRDGGAAAERYAASSASRTTSGGSSGGTVSIGGTKPSATAQRIVPTGGVSTGGSSSTGTSTSSSGVSTGSGYAGTNYSAAAEDAAARGDWSAVTRALAARQAKIDAQGGNDRGTTNAQILADLQSRYKSSYDRLSNTQRDDLQIAAGGVTYPASTGGTGTLTAGKGWEDGVDYLARAGEYASAGDREAAYDALRRRGFKMADTGSAGGGTSQDAAYALIDKLYSQSQRARQDYRREIAENTRRLAEHPTRFGTGTNAQLAGKMFKSQDGKYWIQYDATGTPSVARPVSREVGASRPDYSDEEVALLSRYYGGSGDFAELQRQIHNMDVVRTGTGRLIDREGNYASGDPIQPVSLGQWDGTSPTWRDQAASSLREILERIDAGETFGSGAVSIPTASGGGSGSGSVPDIGGASFIRGGSTGGTTPDIGEYQGSSLEAYIRQLYQSSLDAQLASLKSAYDQNVLGYQAQAEQIGREYQAQRDQAAAQSALQQIYMNEVGAAQGLNTGATGQLAMARSAALQGSLADLLAAEGQDRSANALAQSQLAAGYRGDVDAATAQSSADMTEALISEAVRQEQLKAQWEQQEYQRQFQALQMRYQWEQDQYQREQDALSQSNWERQFQASQDAARRSYASDIASSMLQAGVVPDTATLEAAGMDLAGAQALAAVYQAQLAAKYAPKITGGGDTNKTLDYEGLFQAAKESGYPDSFIQNSYPLFGFNKEGTLVDDYYTWEAKQPDGTGGVPFSQLDFDGWTENLFARLNAGNDNAIVAMLDAAWPRFDQNQRKSIQDLLTRYGREYPYIRSGTSI